MLKSWIFTSLSLSYTQLLELLAIDEMALKPFQLPVCFFVLSNQTHVVLCGNQRQNHCRGNAFVSR